MANSHESIKWKLITYWTESGRGRLYCMNQGLAFPAREDGNGNIKPAKFPLWFGPLKRKFKGFSDTFGFEYYSFGHMSYETVPCFCTVEVKTKNDDLSKDQIRVMTFLKSVGVRCYVAREAEDGAPEYFLEEF